MIRKSKYRLYLHVVQYMLKLVDLTFKELICQRLISYGISSPFDSHPANEGISTD